MYIYNVYMPLMIKGIVEISLRIFLFDAEISNHTRTQVSAMFPHNATFFQINILNEITLAKLGGLSKASSHKYKEEKFHY